MEKPSNEFQSGVPDARFTFFDSGFTTEDVRFTGSSGHTGLHTSQCEETASLQKGALRLCSLPLPRESRGTAVPTNGERTPCIWRCPKTEREKDDLRRSQLCPCRCPAPWRPAPRSLPRPAPLAGVGVVPSQRGARGGAGPRPRRALLHFLRRGKHLKGTKGVCLQGGCGACTVLLSSPAPVALPAPGPGEAGPGVSHRAVNSCLRPCAPSTA